MYNDGLQQTTVNGLQTRKPEYKGALQVPVNGLQALGLQEIVGLGVMLAAHKAIVR
jgi:hypothetical protein